MMGSDSLQRNSPSSKTNPCSPRYDSHAAADSKPSSSARKLTGSEGRNLTGAYALLMRRSASARSFGVKMSIRCAPMFGAVALSRNTL